jgi:hypothetical protein
MFWFSRKKLVGSYLRLSERGMTIDRAVPDAARGVVLRVAGTDRLAAEVSRQVGEDRIVDSSHSAPPASPAG